MRRYFVGVQSRGLLALPAALRKRYKLDSPGVQVELVERDDGVIELRPHIAVPVEQAWFWTPGWQEGEKQATEELRAGEGDVYEGGDDLLAALEKRSKSRA